MFHQSPNYLSALPLHQREIARVILTDPLLLGIDKLRIGFPVRRLVGGDDMWYRNTEEHHKKTFIKSSPEPFGSGTLFITFMDRSRWNTPVSDWGAIEFNPSTVTGIQPWLATWDQTLMMLPEAFRLVEPYFEIGDRDEIRVSRLDLALDFEPVLDLQSILKSACEFEPIRGKKPMVFSNPVTGRLESVTYKGREAPTISIYDKTAQSGHGKDRLRIEVRLKRRELKKFGLQFFDATDEQRSEAFRTRLVPLLERLQSSAPRYVDQILASKQDTKALVTIAGYEALGDIGIKPRITKHTRTLMRSFRRKYPFNSVKEFAAPLQRLTDFIVRTKQWAFKIEFATASS